MTISGIDRNTDSIEFCEDRVDLAAAFRWTARLNMHEAVSNHFSCMVSDREFLVNPRGRHFAKVRASELLLVKLDDGERADVDASALAIHGAIHRAVPAARCIMHVHSKYATALACLKDKSMPPIDNNTMRFYERIAVDEHFGGIGIGGEAERLAAQLGDKPIVLMGNHGVMAVGDSIGRVFDDLYHFEWACEILFTALSSGRELAVVSHAIAKKTAEQWEQYLRVGELHFDAIKRILDEEEPEYRS